jgi:general secretion pathway protein D
MCRSIPGRGLAPIVLLAATSLLTSCTSTQSEESEPAFVTGEQSAAPTATVDASRSLSTTAVELVAEEQASQAKPIVYRGNDRLVNMPPTPEPVRFVGDDVSLNFEQAPMGEIVHAILGDILGLDYIVDHPIKGQVTLRTRSPIPRGQVLRVLESLLESNGSLMIRGKDGRYLITSAQAGSRLAPSVSSPGDRNAGYSTIVVPLKYISASAMADILKPLADEKAFVRIDNTRGLLMLAGTRAQLDGWLDIVNTFDVNALAGMSVGMFPLENTDAEEVSALINEMLSGSEGNAHSITGLVRVIPFNSLNGVLVVSPRSHYLDIVGTWIERLDITPDSSYEKRLFVYPVQNTTASRLAELLTGIYSGGGATARTATQRGGPGAGGALDAGGVAPGLSPESLGGGGGGSASGMETGFSSGSGGEPSLVSGTLSGLTGRSRSPIEDVRVVADEENNALIIYATGKQYKLILAALEKLDIVATQIIIEASILEVTLTDALRYGLEWTFKNGLGSDYDGVGLLANTDVGPAAVIPGFSYTVTNSIGDISAVLNALSRESLVNIISTPSVMVLDNHEAYIHVGQQIPIIDQQSTSDASDTSRITQSVTYRDTGVKLTVRPSVNAGGLVTMDVAQSVTDVGDVDIPTGQRSFLERNIQSRVAVRSDESVVLGGLIRENATSGSSGLPWLHKIPVVGGLFGAVEETDTRTELVVIITPRALYNTEELREVSDEMRSRVRNLDLIEPPGV